MFFSLGEKLRITVGLAASRVSVLVAALSSQVILFVAPPPQEFYI